MKRNKLRLSKNQCYAQNAQETSSRFTQEEANCPCPTYCFQFQKLDWNIDIALPGAEFVLLGENGCILARQTSDQNGYVNFYHLRPGCYRLAETKASPGYIPNYIQHIIRIQPNGKITADGICSKHFKLRNRSFQSITFQKVDELGNALEGAIFEIRSGNTLLSHAHSLSNGSVIFEGLTPGEYTIQERLAPTGYQPDTTLYRVILHEDGTTLINGIPSANFSVINRRILQSISFLKQDRDTQEPIAGSIFEIALNGSPITQSISDANGTLNFSDLSPGTYTLYEVSPAPGYFADTTTHTLVIQESGFATIDQIDVRDYVAQYIAFPSLTITKTNASNIPLQGGTFVLSHDGTPITTSISDENGLVILAGLEAGSYELVETVAPEGYAPDTAIHTIVVTSDGTITVDGNVTNNFNIINTILAYDLSFTKIDSISRLPVAGATFAILQNGVEIKRASSNAAGQIDFGSLVPGDYTLSEVSPTPGYLSQTTIYPVVVTSSGEVMVNGMDIQSFQVTNTPFPNFSLTKINNGGLPLENAVFTLSQNGTVIQTQTTDQNGIATFLSLSPGTYQLEETVPPPGYQSNATINTIVVSETGMITVNGSSVDNVTITNTPLDFDLTFTKEDRESRQGIPGATFTLTQQGQVIATQLSNSAGQVVFDRLLPGTYLLQETNPAPGYIPNPAPYTVIVNIDGSITVDGTQQQNFSVLNARIPIINFRKISDTGMPLSGAVFELRQGTNVIAVETSDNQGNVLFPPIFPGIYVLEEITPPVGYQPNMTLYPVEVTQEGDVFINRIPAFDFAVINISNQISITGQKTWDDNNNSANTRPDTLTIALYQNGTLIDTQITDTSRNWQYAFEGFPETDPSGNLYVYTVNEEIVPPGYLQIVNGFDILNVLRQYTITIRAIDAQQGMILYEEVYVVNQGEVITLEAPNILGYTALPPTSQTFYGVTQDIVHDFYYERINTN